MSVVARLIRQSHEGAESATLTKVLVLPDVPTMGARLDLRAEGVEDALVVVGVTLKPIGASRTSTAAPPGCANRR